MRKTECKLNKKGRKEAKMKTSRFYRLESWGYYFGNSTVEKTDYETIETAMKAFNNTQATENSLGIYLYEMIKTIDETENTTTETEYELLLEK
jgi:hypothetical protein